MALRITVLGGSSPFTIALIAALAEVAPQLPPLRLTLFGRQRQNAVAVCAYVRPMIAAFGWKVDASSDLDESLAGADMVIHQIRYGGMEGRREDEQFCNDAGVQSDETLGLGGTNALLRTSRLMRPVGEALSRHCRDAWIINLTNPLSAVTTLLNQLYGLSRCLGVCELPVHTAERIAGQLGIPFDALAWSYSGLNHRGFLHHLEMAGRNVLPDLVATLPESGFGGIPGYWLRDLNAVPLKYFALLIEDGPAGPADRADFLIALKETIFAELQASPAAMPASLGNRDMPWYRQAVVPLVLALTAGYEKDLVASVPNGSLVTPELKIAIDNGNVRPVDQPAPPNAVEDYLRPLIAHEQAVIEATLAPSAKSISEAIRLDPLIPDEMTSMCAGLLARRWL